MIDNIKNGSRFVVTAAGAQDVIHQLPNFTPVVQENATYPNDDHAFYPNGILPDGANRPVPVAEGLKLETGMVITVDQLVYHCAKTAGDQKAYQCVHGAVARPGDSESDATTGYFYLTYADVTRVELYTAPVEPPGPVTPVDTTMTIIAGSTTYALGRVKDGQIVELKTEVRQGAPPPPPPPNARIHVVQRTLYQGAATNTPNARVSIRDPNGEVLASGTTDANGLAEFPENLCIGANIIHTETPAGFSSGRSAAEREITLGLPDSYHQKTLLQLPVSVTFSRGAGSSDLTSADVLTIIRNAQPNQSFSIGNQGSLLLKFEPPLIHKIGQPILQIMEAGPPGGPGEMYRIVFGNQLDSTSTHVQGGTQVGVAPAQQIYDIHLPNNVADGTRFEWIEIADMDNGGGVANQPPDQRGVDLSCIRGYAVEQSIVVLLDVSGSMSVDDDWVRSDTNETRRESERQVADKSLYSNAFQSVLGSLLPAAPAELLTTTFRMYAFYGVDQPDPGPPSSKHIELLGGPARLSEFRATVAMPEQIRKSYNDYTPLASAMLKGFDDLASDMALCRTMIVITDGEGTPGNPDKDPDEEGTPSNETRPSEKLSKAQKMISHKNWTGVIELIGYKVYPLAAIGKLLRFDPKEGWSVAPHLVNNRGELDDLLKLLRTKYALQ